MLILAASPRRRDLLANKVEGFRFRPARSRAWAIQDVHACLSFRVMGCTKIHSKFALSNRNFHHARHLVLTATTLPCLPLYCRISHTCLTVTYCDSMQVTCASLDIAARPLPRNLNDSMFKGGASDLGLEDCANTTLCKSSKWIGRQIQMDLD